MARKVAFEIIFAVCLCVNISPLRNFEPVDRCPRNLLRTLCSRWSLAFSPNGMVDARVGEVAAAQSPFDGWFRRVVV
jgi:hypothetical protein